MTWVIDFVIVLEMWIPVDIIILHTLERHSFQDISMNSLQIKELFSYNNVANYNIELKQIVPLRNKWKTHLMIFN